MTILQKITVALTVSFVLLLVAFAQVNASNFTFTKTVVQVDNNATVDNNVHTYANSGGNTQTSHGENTTGGNGGGTTNVMQTGNAGSQTIICNDVNHTVINASAGQTCPSGFNSTPTPAPQPTATPVPGNGGCTSNCGGSNGGSGSSSGSSSSNGPSSSSNGAVLGTMASTGTFTENMMNVIALMGLGFLSLGFIQKMKKTIYTLEFEFSF